jgi:tyrosyl-tRNA synthetase
MSWAHQTTVAKLLSHDTFKIELKLELHWDCMNCSTLFFKELTRFISSQMWSSGEVIKKFNVLMGRDYQKNAKMRPQVAMLLPIIHGTCGAQKMSKSLHNYIGILDGAFDQFGKVMSIPDKLMVEWANYASTMNEEDFLKFSAALNAGSLHPNEAKKQLAVNIVSIFHGAVRQLKRESS